MAKPRITVTLGRSGKVVKMGDDVKVDHGRMSGSKRFLQDKPWSNGRANNFMSRNKRQRGDGAQWRSGGSRGQSSRIGVNDLRFKLKHKRGPHCFRSAFEEHRKRNLERVSKDIWPPEDLSKHSSRLGPNKISNLSQITHNGIKDGRHIYPLQTMGGSKSFPGMPQIIPIAATRTDMFSSNGCFDPSRENDFVRITEKGTTARLVTYIAPRNSTMQIRPHVDEEPFSVTAFLNSLGLGKYVIHFKAEEVDMTALRQMRDRDLKELGLPMGPRKKLLLALTAPSRRHLPLMQH